MPISSHAVVDAPGPEPGLRHRETFALGAQHVRCGHPHVVEVAPRHDRHGRDRRSRRPSAAARSSRRGYRAERAPCSAGDGGRRSRRSCPSRSAASRPGFIAPVDHHLRPVITYSSPSRSIEVWMLVASDDATSGSVMQKDDRMLPSSSGASHSRLLRRPFRTPTSNSMLPVSGAAQLVATGASFGLRPSSSQSGAYCRLVSPAPSAPGRNRFQSPRARASAAQLADDGLLRPVAGCGGELLAQARARPDRRARP